MSEFRAARRLFDQAIRALDEAAMSAPFAPGARSPRDVVIHVAAWLREAGERIPALQAGAPLRAYDPDTFNAAAIEAATGWTSAQACGAYKRAADRFDAIASDLDDDTLDEEPDVRAWLESAACVMIGGVGNRESGVGGGCRW